jgi:DsbC/DsbD-like thiol-disulfide interchange protein
MCDRITRRVLRAAAVAGLLIGVACGVGAGQAAEGTKSDSRIKVTAAADKPGADGKQVITVTLTIDKGWHTYANPAGDLGTPTVVKVEGKKGDEVKVDYPEGKLVKDKFGDMIIYEGSAAIKVTVARAAGDSPLKLKVKVQACNEETCLQPATVEVSVP